MRTQVPNLPPSPARTRSAWRQTTDCPTFSRATAQLGIVLRQLKALVMATNGNHWRQGPASWTPGTLLGTRYEPATSTQRGQLPGGRVAGFNMSYQSECGKTHWVVLQFACNPKMGDGLHMFIPPSWGKIRDSHWMLPWFTRKRHPKCQEIWSPRLRWNGILQGTMAMVLISTDGGISGAFHNGMRMK